MRKERQEGIFESIIQDRSALENYRLLVERGLIEYQADVKRLEKKLSSNFKKFGGLDGLNDYIESRNQKLGVKVPPVEPI